jgi:large subunit ribosomal protein L9
MQVILTKTVKKLGKVGETVRVSNGYGRNYLIPRSIAIRATQENMQKFLIHKQELEEKNIKDKILAQKSAKLIEGQHIFFITQSAPDGRLFGSVSIKSIATEVSNMIDTKLNYSNIQLDKPIKFNGVYNVQISLHPEVNVALSVVVAKTESEAQDMLVEFNQSKANINGDEVKVNDNNTNEVFN